MDKYSRAKEKLLEGNNVILGIAHFVVVFLHIIAVQRRKYIYLVRRGVFVRFDEKLQEFRTIEY